LATAGTSKCQNVATDVWSANFGVQDTMLITPMTTDNFGNVYVAGFTLNAASGADIAVVKYDAHGDTVWTAQYTGSGSYRDQATSLYLDNHYNLIVGGFSYVSSANKYDYIIISFDSTGTQEWVFTYNGAGSLNDGVTAITAYNSNIYATGTSDNATTLMDYQTIKLDSLGNLIWNVSYNFFNLYDIPYDIAVIDNNVFVTGASQSGLTDWDYATVQYSLFGTPIDTLRITGTGFGFDHASQVITDNLGYVYITGAVENTGAGLDYKTIKMTQQGVVKWISTYDNPAHDDDVANSITVDLNGNVYVTGQSKNSSGNFDYCTIKYDSLGSTVWTRFYNNGHEDKATRITSDADNNVYLTGSSGNGNSNDFATIGYSSDRDTLWTKRFNGSFNGTDVSNFIKEEDGYIYVSGQSQINTTQYEYITIAYGQAKFKGVGDPFNETQSRNLWYYPNQGQLVNDTGAVADIEFYTLNQFPSLYFKNGRLSYVFSKLDSIGGINDTIHRIDMVFMDQTNNHINARIYPAEESSHHLNFYLPQCPTGVIDCHGNKNLFIEELYRGIDLYFSSNQIGEKHYFVIEPGAKYSNISMKFQGADSVHATQGKYTLFGSIGNVVYDTLVAYEIDALGNFIPGTTQMISLYRDTLNQYFHFTNIVFNASNSLVILVKKSFQNSTCSAIPNSLDQGNIFHSTFYGETTSGTGAEDNNDYSTGMTTDDEGNVYITGFTNSSVFPTTLGAFQENYSGTKDGIILCFDNNMVRKWATYIGGTNNDTLTCITFNPSDNNIYFGGTTASNNHPCPNQLTNAYFDNSYNNNQDAIFGSCQKNGSMNLITYIGGGVTGDEIMLTGNTKSTNITTSCTPPSNGSFPTCSTAGDFVKSSNSGGQDIFLMKFDTDNSLIWSTLIGSNADDKVFDIEPYPVFRSTGSFFYLCGETQKNSITGPFDGSVLTNGDMPLNEISSSTYFQSMAGGFLMEFDNLGNMVWATTINGTKDLQTLTFANNSIYVAGRCNASTVNTCTESSSGLSICYTSGEFNKNTGDLYIGRFNTAGQLTYSTRYNAEVYIFQGFSFDKSLDKVIDMEANDNGDVFILTVGVENPFFPTYNFEPFTPIWSGCYFQPNSIIGDNGDRYDCAILSFNQDNQRNWASFFGGGFGPTSSFGTDYPIFSEFPGAITCFQNKDLFITGYTGKECSTFPLVDAGITPTGQAFYYDDFANSMPNQGITSFADFDVFVTKFDMEAVEVGVKEIKAESIYQNSVYPTLTDNYVNILLNAEFSNSVNIQLYNVAGNLISNSSHKLFGIGQSLRVDLSVFATGIYYIRIIGQQGNSESFKIIRK
jgi:hypothetical protein